MIDVCWCYKVPKWCIQRGNIWRIITLNSRKHVMHVVDISTLFLSCFSMLCHLEHWTNLGIMCITCFFVLAASLAHHHKLLQVCLLRCHMSVWDAFQGLWPHEVGVCVLCLFLFRCILHGSYYVIPCIPGLNADVQSRPKYSFPRFSSSLPPG